MIYLICKEDLYSLPKLYDLFFLKKVGSTKILGCPNRIKTKVLKLYKRVFITSSPKELQEIIIQSNKLIISLISEYGDFTKDSVFHEIDSLDRMELSEIADSF